MSQHDHTLQEALEQHLAPVRSGQEPDAWMRDLLEWLLEELLDLEGDQHLEADRYERTDNRRGYRNEYYARGLFTRVGRLTLRVPRDHQGPPGRPSGSEPRSIEGKKECQPAQIAGEARL